MRSLCVRLVVATMVPLFLLSETAIALGPPVVVTGNGHSYTPGSSNSPGGAVTITPGSELNYLNLADHDHSLTSLRRKKGTPLFDSGTTGPAELDPVVGVADLPPGRYPFFCVFHDDMKGLLVVQEL